MRTEQEPNARSRFQDILFEGTTSHNGRSEILAAFDQIAGWPEASQTCTYYQGCGCDLISLACSTVDTHVLSDKSSGVFEDLSKKFRRLTDEGFINKLQYERQQWCFELGGHTKEVIFTTRRLDELDFDSQFGKPLGIIFGWNCGDSARPESFWRAISQQIVTDGKVIGSYANGFEASDRQAFVMSTDGEKPVLQGCNDYDDVQGDERKVVMAKAELGVGPQTPYDNQIIELNSQAYLISWAGKNRMAITRIWRQPVGAFGLQLVSVGDRICQLTKRGRGNK